MRDAHHIAQDVKVDIHLPSIRDAALESVVRRWCIEDLLEEVDRSMGELCPEDLYIRIPRLVINLQYDRPPWEEGARLHSGKTMHETMDQMLREAIVGAPAPLTQTERLRLLAETYLRRGILPDGESPERLRSAISRVLREGLHDAADAMEFLRMLSGSAVLQRWLQLAGAESMSVLLSQATDIPLMRWRQWMERSQELLKSRADLFEYPGELTYLTMLVSRLPELRQSPRRLFSWLMSECCSTLLDRGGTQLLERTRHRVLDTALAYIDQAWHTPQQATALAESTAVPDDGNVPAKGASSPGTRRHADEISEESVVAQVPDAGLVLLANFLPSFLSAAGLRTDDGELIKHERLPMLLHVVASGAQEAEEWELLLPKILCGLSPEDGCDVRIELRENEEKEIVALLQSVLSHWGALKNTGPDGLRGAFLTRTGRLREKDEHWLLDIPAEAQDILLRQLPWTYSFIRLPWMRRSIIVEW